MASKKMMVLVIAMAFLLSGCGMFRYIDGSSQEEIEQYENPLLWGKVTKLEQSEADHKRTIQELENEIKTVKKDLVQAQTEKDKKLETLRSQVRILGNEMDLDLQALAGQGTDGGVQAIPLRKQSSGVGALKSDITDLKARLAKLEEASRKPVAEAPSVKGKKDVGKASAIRIKVLSGTGDLAVAKKMTETLSQLGYKVGRVDLAPRSDFKAKVIYYAPGYQKTAQQIKEKLGQDVTVKSLSWKSAFHLIILAI